MYFRECPVSIHSTFKWVMTTVAVTTVCGCAWLTDYQYVPPGENKPEPTVSRQESKPAMSAPLVETSKVAAVNNDDVYLVEHEGRLYVFDDEQVYVSFLAHGETAYRLVRIGDGPGGSTLVFGLRDEDKAKTSGIASVDMYDGRLVGAEDFYAEVLHDGRFYVFSEWNDLVAFQKTRSADLRFTEIGAGPDGRTVVYVLNEDNKTVRPDALIERFHRIHG